MSDNPNDNSSSDAKGKPLMEASAELSPEAPDYRDANGEYLPISSEGLKTGVATDLDLFARIGDSFFVIKPRHTNIDGRLIAKLQRDGSPYVYIHSADREKYSKTLEGAVSNIINNPATPIREKAGVLTDYAVDIVDQLFTDPGNPGTIASAKNLTQECVRFIGQHRQAFLHLVELSGHDQYTYAHSVGVAAYTVALVPEVMQVDSKTLVDMGLAALLHDIGKCRVDPKIINKKGPLNEEEWAQMRKHPEYGAEIIRRHKNLGSLVALSAEGHHENLMGTGYPKGLVASRIDPLVRVISLSDAFSALTTKRSYSTPRDSMTALKLIRENLDKKFDATLFKPFVKLFLDSTQKVA